MNINEYLRMMGSHTEQPKKWELGEVLRMYGYPPSLKIL
jgi:hypothetical protein